MADELWASLLAVALLEEKFPENKANWQLMWDKTWRWIKRNEKNSSLVDKYRKSALEYVKQLIK
jgi:hypothetical protein